MSWNSIVEPAVARPVVLTGVLVTEADAAIRARRSWSRRLGVGALVHGLYAVFSWTGSLVIHLAPVIVLMGLLVMERPTEDGFVSIGLSVRNASPEKGPEPPKEPEKPAPPPEPPKPEPEPPKPVEPEPTPPAPEPPKETPKPEPPQPAPVEPEKKPAVIGTGPGAAPPPKAVDPAKIAKDPTGAVMETRAADLERLRGGKETDIVVVAGCYDHTEEVLTHLGVPHTVIESSKLGDTDLSKCGALVIDCNNSYAQGSGADAETIAATKKSVEKLAARVEELQALIAAGEKKKDTRVRKWREDLKGASTELQWKRQLLGSMIDTKAIARKLQAFVAKGGYLFTSDWGLSLVEKAFPGTVKIGGYVGPKNVKIQAKKGAERNPLLREVFTSSAAGSTTAARSLRWQIDGSSYAVRVDGAKVETLVESPEIAGNRAVVVTFRWEGDHVAEPRSETGGRVLHMLSHFADQQDKVGDYALQNMLVNFLLERFTRK